MYDDGRGSRSAQQKKPHDYVYFRFPVLVYDPYTQVQIR